MTDLSVSPGLATGRAAAMLAEPTILRLASSIVASVISGIVVGGLGGRLVMRLSAIAADDSRMGMITDNGNRIGDITGGGTLALMLFVGLAMGLATGLFLFALRTVLPARFLPLTVSIVLLGLGSATVIDPGNPDFTILGNRALNVVMFVSLFPLFGFMVVWLAERFERWLVRPPLVRLASLALVGTALGTGLGGLGIAVLASQSGLPGSIAFVVVPLLGAGVALTRGQAALALRGAALVLLVITTGWGLGGSAGHAHHRRLKLRPAEASRRTHCLLGRASRPRRCRRPRPNCEGWRRVPRA
jgi:hypothetical protein